MSQTDQLLTVPKIKCWQLAFLQTIDTFTFLRHWQRAVLTFLQNTFRLNVYDLSYGREGC